MCNCHLSDVLFKSKPPTIADIILSFTLSSKSNSIFTKLDSGFIKINKIDNCDNVGSYVAKYMTKENEKLIEQKSYFTSRNLEKPIEIINEKEIEILADSLSPTDVVYLNSFVNDYLGLVNYTQYNIKEQVKLNNINPIEVNW